MRRIAFALLATGALVAIAWAQANNSNTWQTPGNQTVGGFVTMCPNGAGVAVPCNNAAAGTNGGAVPTGATPLVVSANGTTAAFSASLVGAAGQFTYICGYMLTTSATAATSGAGIIIGPIASLNFQVAVPALPAVGNTNQTFTPCLPTAAVNTNISVNAPAAGAGGVASIYAWGYRL